MKRYAQIIATMTISLSLFLIVSHASATFVNWEIVESKNLLQYNRIHHPGGAFGTNITFFHKGGKDILPLTTTGVGSIEFDLLIYTPNGDIKNLVQSITPYYMKGFGDVNFTSDGGDGKYESTYSFVAYDVFICEANYNNQNQIYNIDDSTCNIINEEDILSNNLPNSEAIFLRFESRDKAGINADTGEDIMLEDLFLYPVSNSLGNNPSKMLYALDYDFDDQSNINEGRVYFSLLNYTVTEKNGSIIYQEPVERYNDIETQDVSSLQPFKSAITFYHEFVDKPAAFINFDSQTNPVYTIPDLSGLLPDLSDISFYKSILSTIYDQTSQEYQDALADYQSTIVLLNDYVNGNTNNLDPLASTLLDTMFSMFSIPPILLANDIFSVFYKFANDGLGEIPSFPINIIGGEYTYPLRISGVENENPVISNIYPQVILNGEEFFPILLNDKVTDNKDSQEDIIWSISSSQANPGLNVQINQYQNPNDSGLTDNVAEFDHSPGWTGTSKITFTAQDTDGNTFDYIVDFKVVDDASFDLNAPQFTHLQNSEYNLPESQTQDSVLGESGVTQQDSSDQIVPIFSCGSIPGLPPQPTSVFGMDTSSNSIDVIDLNQSNNMGSLTIYTQDCTGVNDGLPPNDTFSSISDDSVYCDLVDSSFLPPSTMPGMRSKMLECTFDESVTFPHEVNITLSDTAGQTDTKTITYNYNNICNDTSNFNFGDQNLNILGADGNTSANISNENRDILLIISSIDCETGSPINNFSSFNITDQYNPDNSINNACTISQLDTSVFTTNSFTEMFEISCLLNDASLFPYTIESQLIDQDNNIVDNTLVLNLETDLGNLPFEVIQSGNSEVINLPAYSPTNTYDFDNITWDISFEYVDPVLPQTDNSIDIKTYYDDESFVVLSDKDFEGLVRYVHVLIDPDGKSTRLSGYIRFQNPTMKISDIVESVSFDNNWEIDQYNEPYDLDKPVTQIPLIMKNSSQINNFQELDSFLRVDLNVKSNPKKGTIVLGNSLFNRLRVESDDLHYYWYNKTPPDDRFAIEDDIFSSEKLDITIDDDDEELVLKSTHTTSVHAIATKDDGSGNIIGDISNVDFFPNTGNPDGICNLVDTTSNYTGINATAENYFNLSCTPTDPDKTIYDGMLFVENSDGDTATAPFQIRVREQVVITNQVLSITINPSSDTTTLNNTVSTLVHAIAKKDVNGNEVGDLLNVKFLDNPQNVCTKTDITSSDYPSADPSKERYYRLDCTPIDLNTTTYNISMFVENFDNQIQEDDYNLTVEDSSISTNYDLILEPIQRTIEFVRNLMTYNLIVEPTQRTIEFVRNLMTYELIVEPENRSISFIGNLIDKCIDPAYILQDPNKIPSSRLGQMDADDLNRFITAYQRLNVQNIDANMVDFSQPILIDCIDSIVPSWADALKNVFSASVSYSDSSVNQAGQCIDPRDVLQAGLAPSLGEMNADNLNKFIAAYQELNRSTATMIDEVRLDLSSCPDPVNDWNTDLDNVFVK